ncbi:MAG: amino acid adenylation domain-containing protein, partial [Actinomycetota bacterium]
LGLAELSIVLTQQHLRAVVPPGDRIVLALDEQWDEVEATPAPATGPAVEPDAPAYVLYTSGSTGTPKGVVNTHRGIANRLQWMQEHLQLTAADAVLQKTPFSFDVSVWELFWPLQVGARLVLARPGGHRDPAYLRQLVAERGITALHFVPSMLRLFLDHDAAPAARELPAGVRHVVCSGEALTAELRDRFVRRWPGPELHNLYGPTEAAVDVTWWRCRPTDRSAVVPIGRPVANTRIHVLDHRRQPVPIGVAGELCIGGVQVAQGYLRRPELTAERFVDEPGGSGRLYRTGDLARWRDDGQLEFLGRTDHQVKIRGNRIELGEIEATIVAHSAVAGAAVTVHDRRHGPQLAAHYTLFQPASVSPATIRAHVGTMLPAFMVPNLFIEHDELPLATSGKVDRHALGAAVATRATVTGDLVAPNDELERFLADVWAEVLGLDQVGVTDRFFELGGDSIQAAEVVNRVQEAVGEFVYVVTMFTSPTVADYARMLRRDYGPAVAARFGASTTDTGGPGPQPGARATSLADRLATLRSAVPRFGPGASWQEGSPNHRAIFVLSPPRSGTSLLRLMLAGHPALFAASELQLLHFDTLAQRRGAFDGRFRLWGEGTIRALMELQGLDAVAATAAMAAAEDADGSVKAFVAQLQEQLGSRILVDKSPSYALDRHAVDNAEAGFDRPFYVHLVRDPHEMVHSFVDYHMDQVLFLDPHGLSAPELAEAVWVESHRTILDFLSTVPADRQLRLRFEDLVDRPRASMEQLTSAVGLDFDDGLVDPYRDLGRKMVDGLHASSTPMGDTRLLERDAIDPGVVDQWRRRSPADVLDPETWSLAASFGYVPPPSHTSEPAPTLHGNGA